LRVGLHAAGATVALFRLIEALTHSPFEMLASRAPHDEVLCSPANEFSDRLSSKLGRA
jgi:hypothetical protein